jgi:hypothetical protein
MMLHQWQLFAQADCTQLVFDLGPLRLLVCRGCEDSDDSGLKEAWLFLTSISAPSWSFEVPAAAEVLLTGDTPSTR